MNDMTQAATGLSTPVDISRSDLADAVRSTATLADLTISMWSGERTDRKLSEELKVTHNAVGHTGRYLKNLMAGCDARLKEVRAAFAAARTAHYQLTLPWVSNPHADRAMGPRLLPNLLFERYLEEMSRLKREATQKLQAFLHEYPSLVTQAQQNLGGMANPADYPDVAEIGNSFRLVFDFTPIPAANAFVNLPDSMIEKLGMALQKRQEHALRCAQEDMWRQVKEKVGHMVERLAEPDTKFKSSTVENVRELITLLPGFNCAGDTRVATVVSDIDRMLAGVDSKQLRDDDHTRVDVVNQARAISNKLDQWGL